MLFLILITMTSTVTYLGDLRTELKHLKSGQTFVTDAPTDNKGKGEAFSPTDLCATSLATCMLTVMGISAREHGIEMTGALAEVTKEMASDPRRISKVTVTIHMPKIDYSEGQKRILEHAGRTCPVSFSLSEGIEQKLEFIWPS